MLTEEFRAELKAEKEKSKADRQSIAYDLRAEVASVEKQALKEREQLAEYLKAVHQKVKCCACIESYNTM